MSYPPASGLTARERPHYVDPHGGISSSHPRLRAPAAREALLSPSRSDRELVAIVGDAASGDQAAWTRLVGRFDRTLRTIARSYRLPPVDVDDVVQATWVRLYEHIDRIREPAAVASWLATTCRRECVRVLQVAVRERPTDDPLLGERADGDDPEARVLAAERRVALTRALGTLPERHRRLMTLLLVEPPLEYRQISEILAMPVGSIGPIRARCVARLVDDEQLRDLHDYRFTSARITSEVARTLHL